MSEWFSGSGERVEFEDILNFVKQHSNKNGIVYVGCDSFMQKSDCTFSTAICLCHAENQAGGRYFVKRTKFEASKFKTLIQRITAEVEDSISTGMRLLEYHPQAKIELHLDVSSSDRETKTSKFADMMIGYARGSGFDCKIKPQAFAASSVADKHSK
jgi:predicted RNase H-related nuclease YkuK (DUF458 family)